MKTTKSKSKKVDDLKSPEKVAPVSEESKTIKKKQKTKKVKPANDVVAVEAKGAAKNLSAADIAKIEKKKAKKQAQKLKKQQNKASGKAQEDNKQAKGKQEKTVATVVSEEKSPAKKETKPKATAVKEKTLAKKEIKQKGKAAKKGNNKEKDAEKRERDPAAEAATVFVGNLPINTKRVQLVRLFKDYGTVHSIRMRTAGGKQLFKHKQRKGAGSLNAYVVLESVEAAEKALALNGTEFKENHLRITPASKSPRVTGGEDTKNEQIVNDADAKRTVFVGSLKYSANVEKLREIFSSCGEIDYIRCLQDGEKGCKGVAYVCFNKPDAVGLALELNETLLDDRPIHVERYAVKKLGAKKARDAAAAKAASPQAKAKKQNAAGAKKRIDKKNTKQNGTDNASKKKSEYRGVKVEGNKKHKKPKKTNDKLKALAKKIAPKPKT